MVMYDLLIPLFGYYVYNGKIRANSITSMAYYSKRVCHLQPFYSSEIRTRNGGHGCMHTHNNPRIGDMEAGGLKVRSHLWLHVASAT